MANITNLFISAFGRKEDLLQFDQCPPKFKGPEIEISYKENSRNIYSEFKSQVTSEVLYGLIGQMQDLSLLVDIHTEPGYSVLLYREDYRFKFETLFEIVDCRDDEFFNKFDPTYLEKFDKIQLNTSITDLIRDLPTGKIYLNLLNNPDYYINT